MSRLWTPPTPVSYPEIGATAIGLITENFSRQVSVAGATLIDGTAYFMLVGLRAGTTVSNISIATTNPGVGMSLSKVGLYAKDGTKLTGSADLGTSWQTGNVIRTHAVTPYLVLADDGYYICVIGKTAVTMPNFMRASNQTAAGAIGSGMQPFGVQTGQTDLPSPATVTFSGGSPLALWVGVS